MTRAELLHKLVVRRHLGVAERGELGALPTRREVEEVVLGLLQEDGWYPPTARPSRPGEAGYEGNILERRPDGRCRAHLQGTSAFGALNHVATREFPSCAQAVADLFARELTEGIDGLRFAPPPE